MRREEILLLTIPKSFVIKKTKQKKNEKDINNILFHALYMSKTNNPCVQLFSFHKRTHTHIHTHQLQTHTPDSFLYNMLIH